MSPLVSTDWLAANPGRPGLVIADVRWHADRPLEGHTDFAAAHIPGAVFLDLETVLSDRSDLRRGRHPLPDPSRFCTDLAQAGIGVGATVVAYDDAGGSIAARLWWMMRWIGTDCCSILDGGLTKWLAEKRPVASGDTDAPVPATPFTPRPNARMIISRSEIPGALAQGSLLIDARAPERFRGEVEPIDAVAGHIPGAVNAYWADSLQQAPNLSFRSPEELRERFRNLGVRDGRNVVCYCGSGVTSCHTVLALERAGFPGARLYPGSWSEWIANSPETSFESEPATDSPCRTGTKL